MPDSFVFSPDGKFLYGSSYYTGASNIFRYELATKKIEAVSNAETGFFRPIPLGGDELIVFRYTGQGFVPARITATPIQDVNPITFLGEQTIEKHPVLKTWAAARRAPRSTTTRCPRPRARTGWAAASCRESFYPIVQGYKDTAAVGLRVQLLRSARLQPRESLRVVLAERRPARQRARASARASTSATTGTCSRRCNDADFYDLFGPTKVSRKGYSIGLGHTNTLIFDEPRRMTLEVEGRVAGNLDQLPRVPERPRRRSIS